MRVSRSSFTIATTFAWRPERRRAVRAVAAPVVVTAAPVVAAVAAVVAVAAPVVVAAVAVVTAVAIDGSPPVD